MKTCLIRRTNAASSTAYKDHKSLPGTAYCLSIAADSADLLLLVSGIRCSRVFGNTVLSSLLPGSRAQLWTGTDERLHQNTPFEQQNGWLPIRLRCLHSFSSTLLEFKVRQSLLLGLSSTLPQMDYTTLRLNAIIRDMFPGAQPRWRSKAPALAIVNTSFQFSICLFCALCWTFYLTAPFLDRTSQETSNQDDNRSPYATLSLYNYMNAWPS